MITVKCPECSKQWGRPITSEFPDRDGAEGFARRHAVIYRGHQADIQEEP